MNSPIKYYGGKSYMTDIIINQFPNKFDVYIEGFGGGASVLFSKPYNAVEIYNDLNQNVYSLFYVLQNKQLFQQFKRKLDLTYYSKQLHYELKQKLKDKNISMLERAYCYFYVNRTGFNAVGGFSTYLVSRRNMSKSTSDFLSAIDGLYNIHQRLSSVIIENRDIIELIQKYDHENVFFYLDPPYIQQTRASNQKYQCQMSNQQHQQLIDVINTSKAKFLISGYNHPIYNKLNGNFQKFEFISPNSGSNAIQVLWRNYKLQRSEQELF